MVNFSGNGSYSVTVAYLLRVEYSNFMVFTKIVVEIILKIEYIYLVRKVARANSHYKLCMFSKKGSLGTLLSSLTQLIENELFKNINFH